MHDFSITLDSLKPYQSIGIGKAQTVNDLITLLEIYQSVDDTKKLLEVNRARLGEKLAALEEQSEKRAGGRKKYTKRKKTWLALQKTIDSLYKDNQTLQVKTIELLEELRPKLLTFFGYDDLLGYPYGFDKAHPTLNTDNRTSLSYVLFDTLLLLAKIAPKNILNIHEEEKVYSSLGYQFNLKELIHFNLINQPAAPKNNDKAWFKSSIPNGLNDAFCSMDVFHFREVAKNRKLSLYKTLNPDAQYTLGESEKLRFEKSRKKASLYFFKMAKTKPVEETDISFQTKMRENIYDAFLPQSCIDILTSTPPDF